MCSPDLASLKGLRRSMFTQKYLLFGIVANTTLNELVTTLAKCSTIVAYKSHDFPSKRFRFDGLQMTRIGAAKRHDRHRERPPTAIAAPD